MQRSSGSTPSPSWMTEYPTLSLKELSSLYPWSDLFGRDPPLMTIKVMSLIPATSHSVPNQSKECWRLQADDAIRATSSAKSSDAIPSSLNCNPYMTAWHIWACKVCLGDSPTIPSNSLTPLSVLFCYLCYQWCTRSYASTLFQIKGYNSHTPYTLAKIPMNTNCQLSSVFKVHLILSLMSTVQTVSGLSKFDSEIERENQVNLSLASMLVCTSGVFVMSHIIQFLAGLPMNKKPVYMC